MGLLQTGPRLERRGDEYENGVEREEERVNLRARVRESRGSLAGTARACISSRPVTPLYGTRQSQWLFIGVRAGICTAVARRPRNDVTDDVIAAPHHQARSTVCRTVEGMIYKEQTLLSRSQSAFRRDWVVLDWEGDYWRELFTNNGIMIVMMRGYRRGWIIWVIRNGLMITVIDENDRWCKEFLHVGKNIYT